MKCGIFSNRGLHSTSGKHPRATPIYYLGVIWTYLIKTSKGGFQHLILEFLLENLWFLGDDIINPSGITSLKMYLYCICNFEYIHNYMMPQDFHTSLVCYLFFICPSISILSSFPLPNIHTSLSPLLSIIAVSSLRFSFILAFLLSHFLQKLQVIY